MKQFLTRKFRPREIIAIMAIVVLLLGVFYYFVGYRHIHDQMDDYDPAELETQLTILQGKLANLNKMRTYLDNHKNDKYGEVAKYNNLSNEIGEVGAILNGTNNLSISWGDPTLTDKTVRREVRIKFETPTYQEALDYIYSLRDCRYRILIDDISLQSNSKSTFSNTDIVTVNVKATLFETVDENTNLDGLKIVDTKK